jgi:VWFA-related protein
MGYTDVSDRACLTAALIVLAAGLLTATQEQQATFRSSLDLVSVAVVVRDGDGRLVKGLRARDFEVLDGGKRRAVTYFQQGRDADARLALLVDASGSMVVGVKPERTRLAADLLIAGLRRSDTATVFSFDSGIRRLTPYTANGDTLRTAVSAVVPYGSTGLFDAIVGAAQSVQADTPPARALVLLTDGVDTASLHSADDAATAAARLDLPVYVLGVGSLTEPARAPPTASDRPAPFSLSDLARRTGGLSTEATSAKQLERFTRTILDELHHQYVLAFPGAVEPGWHPLEVKVRRGRVNARSRDGYFVR